jgi:thiamine biosynthesis lipoprotein
MTAERRLRIMGSDAHLLVVGGDERLLDSAEQRLQDLEHKWSRFLPRSEVSRLNAQPGKELAVSDDTVLLFSAAVEANRLTLGLFDPTVLASLLAKGYTANRYGTGGECRIAGQPAAGTAPGCHGIDIDPASNTVRMPVGTAFDAGGIGKGLAADIVTEELVQAGASGALVNLGGDLRLRGRAPETDSWVVDIEDPFAPELAIATVRMVEGAIASSSTLIRNWVHRGAAEHHLIDPRTGDGPTNDVVAASVVAGAGWMAEAFCKVAMLASTPAGALKLIEDAGLTGLVVKVDGTVEVPSSLGAFL